MAQTFRTRTATTALIVSVCALMAGSSIGQTVKIIPEMNFLSPVGPQEVTGTSSVIVNGVLANTPNTVDGRVVSGVTVEDDKSTSAQVAQSIPPAAEMDQDQAVILLQKLQQENQRLTNENEELKHQVQQLKLLLSQMPGAGAVRGSSADLPAAQVAPVTPGSVAASPAGGTLPGQNPTAPANTAPIVPAQTAARATTGPLDLSAIAAGETVAQQQLTPKPSTVGGTLGSGTVTLAPTLPAATAPAQASLDPQSAYDKAFTLLQQGDYLKAQKEFSMFLSAYPNAAQAPNAGYFLGETLYKQGLYKDAGDRFLKAYQAAPKGEMAPQSLLMLGQSLAKLNQPEAACSVYTKLSADFPKLSTPVANRLKEDKKNANCT